MGEIGKGCAVVCGASNSSNPYQAHHVARKPLLGKLILTQFKPQPRWGWGLNR